MKGFHNPFNIVGTYTRIPADDLGHRYKVKKKVPFSDVRAQMDQIRKARDDAKKKKEDEEN